MQADSNPYSAPTTDPVATLTHDNRKVYGGIQRLVYFVLVVAVTMVLPIVGMGIAGAAMAAFSGDAGGLLGIGLYIVANVLALVGSIVLGVFRLQNLGNNPWWAALALVPLANMALGVYLLAFPEGYADHRQLDSAGKVIIGISIGLFLLALLGIAAAIFVATNNGGF